MDNVLATLKIELATYEAVEGAYGSVEVYQSVHSYLGYEIAPRAHRGYFTKQPDGGFTVRIGGTTVVLPDVATALAVWVAQAEGAASAHHAATGNHPITYTHGRKVAEPQIGA